MVALLTWVDGFGADTAVKGIFSTLDAAKRYAEKGDRYVEFEFGLVSFDIDDAKEIYPAKKKRRK